MHKTIRNTLITPIKGFPLHSLTDGLSKTTLFKQEPTPSRETSTWSLCFNQSAGFLPIPTPWGLCIREYLASAVHRIRTYVPVKMRSPGSKVVPRDRNDTVCATLKIISLVDED